MLRTSKKKVTFIEKPAVLGGERHALSGQPHSRTLQSFLPLLVKQLSLSPVSYRQLKDGGVVTTEQIGQIELEGCRERKVAKLLEIVKNAELPVFGAFCVVLGEMGYWYLSQTLQSAAKENMLVTGRAAKNNKDLKEVVLLHKDITHSREANLGLCRKMQYLKCEYDKSPQGQIHCQPHDPTVLCLHPYLTASHLSSGCVRGIFAIGKISCSGLFFSGSDPWGRCWLWCGRRGRWRRGRNATPSSRAQSCAD
ncbi:uncharacterized protein LOC136755076 isoform X2 [Amia ocellicauda]|uniref:uncharacterized protein LOC136755076 isoform X2 n=1 Tax=Amia ocellicauda TaxID=2972642 RepID=UPI0034641F68